MLSIFKLCIMHQCCGSLSDSRKSTLAMHLRRPLCVIHSNCIPYSALNFINIKGDKIQRFAYEAKQALLKTPEGMQRRDKAPVLIQKKQAICDRLKGFVPKLRFLTLLPYMPCTPTLKTEEKPKPKAFLHFFSIFFYLFDREKD